MPDTWGCLGLGPVRCQNGRQEWGGIAMGRTMQAATLKGDRRRIGSAESRNPHGSYQSRRPSESSVWTAIYESRTHLTWQHEVNARTQLPHRTRPPYTVNTIKKHVVSFAATPRQRVRCSMSVVACRWQHNGARRRDPVRIFLGASTLTIFFPAGVWGGREYSDHDDKSPSVSGAA